MTDLFAVRIKNQAGNTIGHVRRHENMQQRSNNDIGQVYHNLAIYHILLHCHNYTNRSNESTPAVMEGEIFKMPLPELIQFQNCIAMEPSSAKFMNSRFGFKVRFSFSCTTHQEMKLLTDFLDALDVVTYNVCE
jgi:hypothetical protein